MKKCSFCDLCKRREGFIYDNKYFFVIFDIHPVSPGHSLIIPKRHIVSILDLKQNEWNSLKKIIADTIKKIEKSNLKELYTKMIKEKLTKRSPWFCKKMLNNPNLGKKPKGYNIGNNEGIIAGRTVHHLHIQIIPRYKGDVKNPIGGIRNIIKGMGNYK